MEGSSFCYFHDPALEKERTTASSRGGRAPRRGLEIGKALERPEILDDPMRIAGTLPEQCRRELNSPANNGAQPNLSGAILASARYIRPRSMGGP